MYHWLKQEQQQVSSVARQFWEIFPGTWVQSQARSPALCFALHKVEAAPTTAPGSAPLHPA